MLFQLILLLPDSMESDPALCYHCCTLVVYIPVIRNSHIAKKCISFPSLRGCGQRTNSTRHHVPGVPCYSGALFAVRIWSGICCNSLEVLQLVSETKPISSGLVIRKREMQHNATFSPHTNHPASETTEKAGNPQLPSRSHFEWHELKMLAFLCIERLF